MVMSGLVELGQVRWEFTKLFDSILLQPKGQTKEFQLCMKSCKLECCPTQPNLFQSKFVVLSYELLIEFLHVIKYQKELPTDRGIWHMGPCLPRYSLRSSWGCDQKISVSIYLIECHFVVVSTNWCKFYLESRNCPKKHPHFYNWIKFLEVLVIELLSKCIEQ